MALADYPQIFPGLNRELWLVSAAHADRRTALIAANVDSVSLVPELPRVTVAIAKHHFTHDLIEASDHFAMQLVDEPNIDWVYRFGITTGRDTDKFAGLDTATTPHGSPILTAAANWLDCRIEARFDTGDRTLYLAEVLDAHLNRHAAGLSIKRLLELAPPDKLQAMHAAMSHDIPLDRAAIQSYRNRYTATP
ncbi:MAG: flavin reductase family protein [Pirellulales bacterium]